MSNIKKFFKDILHVAASSRVRLYIITLVLVCAALTVLQLVSREFYASNILEKERAELQNKSAMISGEFSAYSSLKNAEIGGTYNNLKKYSAMEYVRFRVIDERYVIMYDSYSSEYGRNIINSGVMNAFLSGKSTSLYYRKTGTIEAIVPIYNDEGSIIGALVADSNISRVMTFESDVQDQVFLSIVTIVVVMAIVLALIYIFMFRP